MFLAHLFSLSPNNRTNSHFRILYIKRQHTHTHKKKTFELHLNLNLHLYSIVQEIISFWQENNNSISNGLVGLSHFMTLDKVLIIIFLGFQNMVNSFPCH